MKPTISHLIYNFYFLFPLPLVLPTFACNFPFLDNIERSSFAQLPSDWHRTEGSGGILSEHGSRFLQWPLESGKTVDEGSVVSLLAIQSAVSSVQAECYREIVAQILFCQGLVGLTERKDDCSLDIRDTAHLYS